ncbi:MAG TPA: S53 family peptidase [Gaiellaceae bacterium]|nr:S53 family peptidase [Gaiellaceae bacterium]
MRVLRLRFAAALIGMFVIGVIVVGAAGAGSPASRTTLIGSRPTWVPAVHQTATVPSGQHVDARVWLAPNNQAQLVKLAQAVSDPSSAQYGQYLTTAQYDQQFAPTAAQVSAVSQWLTGAGLSIVNVGPDNHYVAVSGSADAINAAFGTQLALYQVNGTQQQAPSTDLSVPSALAGTVLAVTGLSPFGHATKPADFGAPAAFVNGTPCSSYYNQQSASNLPKYNGSTLPYAICGYTPSQFRSVYGVGGGYSFGPFGGVGLGRGTTVAIVDAYDSPTLLKDANTYAQRRGDGIFSRFQFQDHSVPEDASTGADCGGNGWYGEQTLDVEAVHGMAQNANVYYYGAASCYDDDLLASLAQIVNDNAASIVSNSWGEPTFVMIDGVLYYVIDPDLVAAYESVFEQGALQGIGFNFSSGDNGDEYDAWGFIHPDWPTEDPWVTSVGGTALAIDKNGNRAFETGWGTAKYSLSANGSSWVPAIPFQYGAGGGYVRIDLFDEIFGTPLMPEPWYQIAAGVKSPTGGRAVPDVGMDADPTTGMLIGETQNFPAASVFGPAGVHYGEYRIGGTSLATPLFAGFEAVAQGQSPRNGFANPRLYSLAHRGVYYDVTPQGDQGNVRSDYVNGINASNGYVYSVRTFDQDSSLKTGPGWDDVTGLGSATPSLLRALGR